MNDSERHPAERAVAVIGVGAILPDAPDAPSFWQNVIEGKSSISEVSPERWSTDDYYDPDPAAPDKTYSKIGGWVRDVQFESVKFRIPPAVSNAMDGGQKWAVLAAAEALRDAGHPDRALDLESTGVILGAAMGGELHYITNQRLFAPEYRDVIRHLPAFEALPEETRAAFLDEFQAALAQRIPTTTEDTMPGELTNVVAGRVAAVFNLRGPNYTTDAACASSLAALESSVHALVDHHCDVMISGGMDRNMGPTSFIKFCKIGALSPDGSRPYAKGANGFVMGEGGALFVLKRLADAERDGDRIYAVIRAVGASADGKGKGITAPNPKGQILAVRRAWQRAGLPISSMTLLEGHGTSTRVGDVAELEAIGQVMGDTGLPPGSIALGSIKSQIGHLKSAAGAAGLLKAVLAVHNKTLPPSINFVEPNPGIDFAKTPFAVNTAARPWERPSEFPRRAGVSAFGFGGTNFHVVVEEHVPGMLTSRRPSSQVPTAIGSGGNPGGRASAARPPAVLPPPSGDLLALGAPDAAALRAALERALADARAGNAPARRAPGAEVLSAPERLVIAFDDTDDLVKKSERAIKAFERGGDKGWRLLRSKGVHYSRGRAGRVAFLFPGQGSQYVNMLRVLRDREPVVAETFAEADEVMTPILGRPLTSFMFLDTDDPDKKREAESALRDTTVCQPAVLSCDVALTRLFAQHGIVPDFAMGHSLGEWGAVVASGMMPFREALVGVSARAQGMASVSLDDPGKMASVLGPFEEVERRLGEIEGYVVAANINSSKQTVIAGDSETVIRAVDYFNEAGLNAQTIPVSHAFHSKIVAPASSALRNVLGEMNIATPEIPVVSNVDGQLYPSNDVEAIRDRLARQLASPVQFVKGLETLYAEGARIFVEVGPKRVLHGFADDVLGAREGVICLSSNHPKRGDVASFHEAMCGLYAAGLPALDAAPAQAERPQEIALRTAGSPPLTAAEVQPALPIPSAPPADGAVAAIAQAEPPVTGTAQIPRGQGPDYLALGQLFARFLDEGLALYQSQRGAPEARPPLRRPVRIHGVPSERERGSVVISGAGLGLPNQRGHVFADDNVDRILGGESFLEPVPEEIRQAMVDRNIVRLVKREVGEPSLERIAQTNEVIRLAARRGAFDLAEEYGIAPERVATFDITTKLATAAGLEALRDAGIPLIRHYRRTTTGRFLPDRWMLPRAMADETGVIFASAFPGVNNWVDHVERYHRDRARRVVIDELRHMRSLLDSDDPGVDTLDRRIEELESQPPGYELDRRFLFQVLAMGHSQFAELIGARGPNTQLNSACASTTQAVSIAQDWIRMGRCRRVIVIGADDVTSDQLLGWIGSGFLASGAATTEEIVERAALPFDRRRHGMLLGMGACGLVLESQDSIAERGMRGLAEVLATENANSAFHGTRLDVSHITGVMERLVSIAEKRHGISRHEMARNLAFVSHETYTPARGGSAAAEVNALRHTFGDDADSVVIVNTKGFTGHPQGVGIEDAIAVKLLEKQILPPVPNFREPDPQLGNLNLSKGGHYPVQFALRLAAGFGSQVSMSLLRRVPNVEERIASRETYRQWLVAVSGRARPELEIDHRTLCVKDPGEPPGRQPARSNWSFREVPQSKVLDYQGTPAQPQVIAAPAPVPAPAPVAAPAPVPAPAPAPAPVPAPAPAPAADPVAEKVLALVAEKTGYPSDMLALDLDLEADLGIDTVKQAEVFGMVREAFDIPRQDDLRLSDYPTLEHVIGFVRQHRPDLAAPAPAPVAAPASAADPVSEKVLALVAEKTGYPTDMLEVDLDLEADLGIDTVKQAEVFGMVREAFDIPRQDDLKLSDYPTLAHVIGFVREHRPELAAPAPAPAPVAAPAPAPAPSPTPAAGDEVEAKVLALVAEKTGYPTDMLELDLDLEADLGIDTVKQAEVFAMVREAFGIPRQDDLKLSDYPTLGHVIGFVRTHRDAAAPVADEPQQAAADEQAAPAVAAEGSHLIRHPIPMLRPVLSACTPTRARMEQGDRVLVVADRGGVAKALSTALEQRGLEVLMVDDRPDPRAFEALLSEWSGGGRVAGLYFLTPLDRASAWSDMEIGAWRTRHREGIHLLCAAARALYDTLDREGTFLVAATCMGGLHGYGATAADSPDAGAVTGFVKAISRERPQATVKAVDFESDAAPEAIAQILLAETERDPGAVEIGCCGGQRFSIAVVGPDAAPASTRNALALDDQTVFLVTGGAGAVTVEIVRDLARASKGVFHLLDARPMPDEAAQQSIGRLAGDREALKRDIFARIKAESGRATPAQVEKEIFDLERAGAILDALQAVRDLGGRAFYHSVDVTDADAVGRAVDEIRETSGKVDVILHAAGIERSRSLDKKPVEEFELIFAVKSDGLFNLLRATRERGDDLRAVVCFSSVAGRFGNAGQTDYSAGNDLMCKLASAWAAAHRDGLAISLDWSAWGGIGMATRGSIPEMMKRAGIEMLDPAEAVPVVRQMLQTGFNGEAVVGRTLGMLLDAPVAGGGIDAGALTASKPADAPSMALRFDPATLAFDPHRGLSLEARIDPQSEPFLRDHEIDGTPVLPGVMGLEAFAEAALMLAPSHRVEAIEDVEFRAPMKYFRREPRALTVHALPLRDADGRIRVHASLTSTQELVGGETLAKTHFAATVVLAAGDDPDAQPTVEPGKRNGSQAIDREAIYEVYFHGPAYQVLSKVGRTVAGRLEGELSATLPAETSTPDAQCVFHPRLVELCFQTAGVWEIGATGQLGLPAGVDRVSVWKAPDESALVAEVFPSPEQAVAESGEGARFDAYVRDEAGRVYVEIKGYRTSPLPGALPDERLAPFREVVKA